LTPLDLRAWIRGTKSLSPVRITMTSTFSAKAMASIPICMSQSALKVPSGRGRDLLDLIMPILINLAGEYYLSRPAVLIYQGQ